jgi:hypothetical protein
LTERERIACEVLLPICGILGERDNHQGLLFESVTGGQVTWIFLGQVNTSYRRMVKILIN